MIRWKLLPPDSPKGGAIMNWEVPSFVEVKMDAEINSYQDDFKDIPDLQEQPSEAVIAIPLTSSDGQIK